MACTPLLAPSVRKIASGSTAVAVPLQDELGHGLADERIALALAIGAQAVPGALEDGLGRLHHVGGEEAAGPAR